MGCESQCILLTSYSFSTEHMDLVRKGEEWHEYLAAIVMHIAVPDDLRAAEEKEEGAIRCLKVTEATLNFLKPTCQYRSRGNDKVY